MTTLASSAVVAAILASAGAWTAHGQTPAQPRPDAAKALVVTSFYPLYEFTREIAGELGRLP